MDPLETWRPPAQGKPHPLYRIFSALSSLRTGFSPQPTVRSWVAGGPHMRSQLVSAISHLRRCAINKGHPAHQRREAGWLIVIERAILGTAFLAISLGSTLWGKSRRWGEEQEMGGRAGDAEQGTGD